MNGTVSQVINESKNNLRKGMKASCSEIATRVITRTPVYTGSLRASWNANNGPPVIRNVNTKSKSESGAKRNNLVSVINSLKPGDDFSLANGQPYASRIEYEGHSKKQAPDGMMSISLAEWQQIVDEANRGR